MVEIKDIVKGVIQDICYQQADDDSKIERIWESILDDKEARHATFSGIKNGIIIVYVDSPARLFQLKIKKRCLLKKIQEEKPDVQGIRFKIGRMK